MNKEYPIEEELEEAYKTINQLTNDWNELTKQNEQMIFLLERIQKVLPLYYGDLYEEIKNFLDKNQA